MWKFIFAFLKKSTCRIGSVIITCVCLSAYGQQYVVFNKDNTHPDISLQSSLPALISRFDVQKVNDYVEASWTSLREQDIRKYTVEYSNNGTDYQAAGEVIVNNGNYKFKHHPSSDLPSLYRIKMELLNDKSFYSSSTLLKGVEISPVQIYPTIIQGNTININAYLPIERINIFSGSGQQLFTKDINGERDYMAIVIPSLGKGMYWINFYGRGWNTTSKFIVP